MCMERRKLQRTVRSMSILYGPPPDWQKKRLDQSGRSVCVNVRPLVGELFSGPTMMMVVFSPYKSLGYLNLFSTQVFAARRLTVSSSCFFLQRFGASFLPKTSTLQF